jgi:hypothetical protein
MILAIRAFRATIFAFSDAIEIAIAAVGSVTLNVTVDATDLAADARCTESVPDVTVTVTGPPVSGAKTA